jgi:hypothetical protein
VLIGSEIYVVLKSKMHATFINASDKQPVELEVKGDWLDRSATITDTKNGQVVAQISRSRFNMREVFGGQQSVSSNFNSPPTNTISTGLLFVDGNSGSSIPFSPTTANV